MSFTTLTFFLHFLLTFAVYWSVSSARARCVVIVIASYVFYGWWDVRFIPLMLGTSLLDFFCGLWLAREPRAKRLILGLSILGNIGTLGFFKYFNFFIDSAVDGLNSLGWNAEGPALNIILPVGISFYTFQTLSYTIDIYRGKIKPTRNLFQYLAYVSFFPQLVAGPIERATHLLPQFGKPRTFDPDVGADGCRLILWGCTKKMLIADNLGSFLLAPFSIPEYYTGADLLLATLFFAFQIYCDFSAYTDIARGVAKLFGIEIRINFAMPYFSQNIDEFWRRWHISLSTWFRDYVYIPLGGSRVSKPRQAFNIMLVFLVSGLWHGAAWTFVCWGAVHGLAMLPIALMGGRNHRHAGDAIDPGRWFPRLKTVLRILLTFSIVLLSWVFFRADSLGAAFEVFSRIFTWAGQETVKQGLYSPFAGIISVQLAVGLIAGLVVLEWIQRHRNHVLDIGFMPRYARWTIYTILFWLTAYLGTQIQSDFIYFQF